MNRVTRIRRARRAAFTLLEVLMVIVILGVLAVLVLTQLGGAGDDANKRIASIAVSSRIPEALERYKLHVGGYPTEDEGGLELLLKAPSEEEMAQKWAGPYVKPEQLKDPWNQDYRYTYPGRYNENGFDISSNGPDRQEGTEDDITNWEKAS
ncbi:MAG: type II secretion system major pseudopilin GspG [Planctomycetaceae bacterium]